MVFLHFHIPLDHAVSLPEEVIVCQAIQLLADKGTPVYRKSAHI